MEYNVPGGSLVSTYLTQQTLPNSLYLSAQPNWFKPSNAVWPPINPGASTKVNKIPAQICYENGPKSESHLIPHFVTVPLVPSLRPAWRQ